MCIGLEAAVQMVGFYERAGFQKDCITTRRQMLFRSEASLDASPSQRSDVAVVPLHEVSLEAIQRYDERHEISPRPHFLELWLRHRAGDVFAARDARARANAMPELSQKGLIRAHSALLLPIGEGWRVGWPDGSPKTPAWPRCC